ncbi:hypothetical protein GWK47_015725 [Chionoecetes opilio]|uniref:Cathepsin C exclusion domain-containing protein n=1 Tax=Chionoecetes opilio TaxID=41210 RepID=A0A8J5CI76_CHIOP|nr:hypothetical protein GWK47_015725 [Chionoecetes opilio]
MEGWVMVVTAAVLIVGAAADTPGNCTFDDVRGDWILYETERTGDATIDCDNLATRAKSSTASLVRIASVTPRPSLRNIRLRTEEKKTVQQSAAEAAKEVLDFWTRARSPPSKKLASFLRTMALGPKDSPSSFTGKRSGEAPRSPETAPPELVMPPLQLCSRL